jgi:hypothetical protein
MKIEREELMRELMLDCKLLSSERTVDHILSLLAKQQAEHDAVLDDLRIKVTNLIDSINPTAHPHKYWQDNTTGRIGTKNMPTDEAIKEVIKALEILKNVGV